VGHARRVVLDVVGLDDPRHALAHREHDVQRGRHQPNQSFDPPAGPQLVR
jgi:hypothetical protein